MRLRATVVVLTLGAAPVAAQAPAPRTTITLLSFSDYHSHALPFWSEGRPSQGGIARAIAFLRAARQDPSVLVVSGGDMLNKGTPAWSDEFGCVEWPWLDGLVDAMALGNHDLDYGAAAFEECRRGVRFPLLSANLRTAAGTPYFAVDGKPYLVKEVGGVRVGLFAVAGPDVQRLIRAENLPAGTRWADATLTARDVVAALRGAEKADAVVLIGHQTRADDEALARAVPGIDIVLGSHSHFKGELTTIPGTRTRFLSPYQYLTYVAEARLVFAGTRLETIEGRLVKMDERHAPDPVLSARVRQLQAELQRRRPERFARAGHALAELSDAGVTEGECALGNWVADTLRRASGAHVFFISASSFRRALPPGPLTHEDLHSALPYSNKLVTAEMTGRRLLELLGVSVARRDSNDFSQVSGLRYVARGQEPRDVKVLKDPAREATGYAPLDPARTYRVATIDFQAGFIEGYKELFQAAGARPTALDVHTALLEALAKGPIRGATDGRTGPR
jgi:5'-nucleotidase